MIINSIATAVGLVVLFALIFMLTIRSQPLSSRSVEETSVFYLVMISVVVVYGLFMLKGTYLKDFKKKIEVYLCDLFPHSSNENYARHNLPIANHIRT